MIFRATADHGASGFAGAVWREGACTQRLDSAACMAEIDITSIREGNKSLPVMLGRGSPQAESFTRKNGRTEPFSVLGSISRLDARRFQRRSSGGMVKP